MSAQQPGPGLASALPDEASLTAEFSQPPQPSVATYAALGQEVELCLAGNKVTITLPEQKMPYTVRVSITNQQIQITLTTPPGA